MKQFLKGIFAALLIPLGLAALLGVLFLLHEAWEFMTLPTSESIERLIKAELPRGTDKGKVLDFLKTHELGGGDLRKVTASDKKREIDYQEEHIKSQIDLIEYDVGGWRWTASWSFYSSYVQVRFYFNKDEKLIDYTLRKSLDAP
jgi:hypothetical protein